MRKQEFQEESVMGNAGTIVMNRSYFIWVQYVKKEWGLEDIEEQASKVIDKWSLVWFIEMELTKISYIEFKDPCAKKVKYWFTVAKAKFVADKD